MIDQSMGNPAYTYAGQTPQQMQKFSNPLSNEEIELLTKSKSHFNLNITNEERLRGICNHRTADGMSDAIVKDNVTGALRCEICGYTFKQVDPNMTSDEIKNVLSQVIDLLQTTKLMFIDMPANAAREYYQIIPLLEKLPELFEMAAKNMAKHDAYGWNYTNPNMSAYSMFQNLSNIYGQGLFMGNPGMGAPQPMGNPYGAPQPMPGPYGAPQMGNPYGAPASNGFMMYNSPAPQPMGYQPQSSGYAYNPGTVAQAAPTTIPRQVPPETVETVKPEETTTVQQTIKA